MLFGFTPTKDGLGYIFWTNGIGGGTSASFCDTKEQAQATYDRFVAAYGSPDGIPINTRPNPR